MLVVDLVKYIPTIFQVILWWQTFKKDSEKDIARLKFLIRQNTIILQEPTACNNTVNRLIWKEKAQDKSHAQSQATTLLAHL